MDDLIPFKDLITPLPKINYVETAAEVERLRITVYPDGHLVVEGLREEISKFHHVCAQHGIHLEPSATSRCG